ncbi:MAG: DUF2156 domain-containing protein [Alphaproteobacteria bacterium]|jgi:hypothetical protein|nr:DUF2156 domain-containing protein [Alphaproteobacteria bacterium]QQS57454.1 MAG: DUF2156 domain-containing protein [Alphaproteobacteria bacterium]
MNDALKGRDIAQILYRNVGNDNLATDSERAFVRRLNKLDEVAKVGIWDLTSLKHAFAVAASNDPYYLSPTYYAVTGRRGLWLFNDEGEDNHYTSFFFCLHPNLKDTVVVFPPFGDHPVEAVAEFLHKIRESKMNIRIGRVPQGSPLEKIEIQYPQLQARTATETVLDWTFPVHTVDCEALVDREGKDYGRIRQAMNKFKRSSALTREMDFSRDIPALEKLARQWESNTRHYDAYDLRTNYFNYLARLAIDQKALNLRGMVVSIDGVDKGFSIWEPESNGGDTANLFASQVTDFDMTNLATYLTVVSAEKMLEEGTHFMCLGGSETAGMDRYKRGFNPSVSTQLNTIEIKVPEDFEP